jgi:hypothetical protein
MGQGWCSRRGAGKDKNEEELTAPLYQEIGRLKMEVEWRFDGLTALSLPKG